MNNLNHKEEEFARDLLQNAKKVTLSTSEKASIYSRLNTVMNQSPARLSWYDSFELSKIIKTITDGSIVKFVPVALVAVLVLMVSVSFSARNSLPGELLYPVKVGVNENVQSFATFGEKSSAEVDAMHASTRLNEAEQLVEQNKLSTSAAVTVEKTFSDDADKVKKQADSLEAKGNTVEAQKINSDFEVTLQSHSDLIQALSSSTLRSGKDSELISGIKNKVLLRLKEFTQSRERGQAKIQAAKINITAAASTTSATTTTATTTIDLK